VGQKRLLQECGISRKIAKYLTRHYLTGNGVLPGATFFAAAIYVLAIHGVVYPMNRRIFKTDGVRRPHYSSIPSSHHSNGERSELSSYWNIIRPCVTLMMKPYTKAYSTPILEL
jgi:hypothetical protein